MIVKKYIIVKLVDKELISNVNNSTNNNYYSDNNLSFNLSLLKGIVKYFEPFTLEELRNYDSLINKVEFDTEKEVIYTIENIINCNLMYNGKISIISVYRNITDETEIRRLKSKEILTEE